MHRQKLLLQRWRLDVAGNPTVTTSQCVKNARTTGSGCTFRITVDSLEAIFAGHDSCTVRFTVQFTIDERSLSCHIPLYAGPIRRQKFVLNDCIVDAR